MRTNIIISNIVKQFYERITFPDYENADDFGTLIRKAEENSLALLLDEELPLNFRIVDVGCGTGQLVNYLARNGREVWGVDFSSASLKKAELFQKKHLIKSAHFVCQDIFSLHLPNACFNVVYCNGVLHHMEDPRV